MKGPYKALFYQASPEISLVGSILGSFVEFHNDQRITPTWFKRLENAKYINGITQSKFHWKILRFISGAL